MIISSPLGFQQAARKKLPRFLFDYIDGGAGRECTLARNVGDLSSTPLRQRVLSGVTNVRLDCELFGRPQALPIVLAPVGLAGMYARRGEVQAARAAAESSVPFCLSTMSVCDVEEVRANSGEQFWFQLYVMRDRGVVRELMARAKAAGCRALVCTVDMPLAGIRYRDAESGLSGRFAAARRYWQAIKHPQWAWDVGVCGRPHRLGNLTSVLGNGSGIDDFMGWIAANFDPTVGWSDVDWIRDVWDGPLILKGILDVEDARAAAARGVDGIVVSNHGGRQLDGAISTVSAVEPIANEVGHRLTVLADSGVRCGADVVRLLALGAKGVLLGRAWAYALAAQGGSGVTALIAMLSKEIRVAMTLVGVSDVAKLDISALALQKSRSGTLSPVDRSQRL